MGSQINSMRILFAISEKVLILLRNPRFELLMSGLNVKEMIVIFLRFGYVDGRCFSTTAISEFLNITVEEINSIIEKSISMYKKVLEIYIDESLRLNNINVKKIRKRQYVSEV